MTSQTSHLTNLNPLIKSFQEQRERLADLYPDLNISFSCGYDNSGCYLILGYDVDKSITTKVERNNYRDQVYLGLMTKLAAKSAARLLEEMIEKDVKNSSTTN